MNAATMPAPQLAVLLAESAASSTAESAAVELIGRHGHLLRNPAFRRLIAAGSAVVAGAAGYMQPGQGDS